MLDDPPVEVPIFLLEMLEFFLVEKFEVLLLINDYVEHVIILGETRREHSLVLTPHQLLLVPQHARRFHALVRLDSSLFLPHVVDLFQLACFLNLQLV